MEVYSIKTVAVGGDVSGSGGRTDGRCGLRRGSIQSTTSTSLTTITAQAKAKAKVNKNNGNIKANIENKIKKIIAIVNQVAIL